VMAGLLAHGSQIKTGLPGIFASGTIGFELTAHSCGGSYE
jgi:hypothetical protein